MPARTIELESELDHKSFAVFCPFALLYSAVYVVLVHRLMIYAPRLPTPHLITLVLLHLAWLAMVSSRRDLHP